MPKSRCILVRRAEEPAEKGERSFSQARRTKRQSFKQGFEKHDAEI